MAPVCFVCDVQVGTSGGQDETNKPYPASVPITEALACILGEIFNKQFTDIQELHSSLICRKCLNSAMEYEKIKIRMEQVKRELTTNFSVSISKHGYNLKTYPKKEPVKIVRKVVVPASKLQPLPANYVLDAKKIPLSINTVRSANTSPIKTIKLITTTEEIDNETSPVKIEAVTSSVETNIANSLSSILGVRTSTSVTSLSQNDSVLTFNVDALPTEFLDDNTEMKKERSDEQNVDDNSMEIDEGTEESTMRASPLELHCESEQSPQHRYIDVRLDNDDDGSETIVMTGENGSILGIMSGKKLVYENGEITFADNDEDSNTAVDNDDGHDSTGEESQIELQVSGDEETANAIIAAAREQGGAFIKVESGEMFRVKSVKSKHAVADEASESSAALAEFNMVTLKDNQFKCLLCEKANRTETLLPADAMMAHLRSEHGARLYLCGVCNKWMRRRRDYTAHQREHTGPPAAPPAAPDRRHHACHLCNHKYNSKTLLQEHMNTHTGSRPFECPHCGKAFASKYTHLAHVKTHMDRPRPFKCAQCGKSFLSAQNLSQHEKTHLGLKAFTCPVCGKAFSTQHNLEVHAVVHSGTKPFVCGVCNKAFARKAEIRDHMRTHTGERPFSCEICGASFAQRSNLHSHRRATHNNDKRHRCLQCPKQFKRRRLLEYHVKAAHTGERPLQCAECRATFVYPEHYKKHLRIHTGERPFVCEVCGKSFSSRDNRNTHRFTHSDKKPYECVACGAGYMRKQLLYAHMNSTGHLAESIVVNQPRLSNEEKKLPTGNPPVAVPATSGSQQSAAVVQDGSERALLSLIQALDQKADAAAPVPATVQMVTSDESGEIRLVQLQLTPDAAGLSWTLAP